jgi:large subunit ribosomal protein L22
MAEAKALLRYAKLSPQKARLVVDLIRGKKAGEALTILKFTLKRPARIVSKVLRSAVANAEQKDLGDVDALRVSRAFVDGGPVQKRFQARAMGKGAPIKKRTSHITIVVSPDGSAGISGTDSSAKSKKGA